MKHKLRICGLLCSVILVCCGCSRPDFATIFMDGGEKAAYYKEHPQFWKQAAAIDETHILYELQNDFFSGKPYNNLKRFSDNLLLIGEASYSSPLTGSFFNQEENYEFSFDLYNPWSNRIIASLSHTEISCTSYQVCGDRLFLFDAERGQMSVYDDSLKKIGAYDVTFWDDPKNLSFYPAGAEDSYLVFERASDKISRITLSGADVLQTELTLPYYNVRVLGASPDRTLTLLGVSKESLLESVFLYQPLTGEITECYSAAAFSGFPANADIAVLPSGSLLVRSAALAADTSHYLLSFSYYGESGEGISHIKYDCGDYSSTDGFVYLSNDFAAFEDSSLCFFLLYNTGCRPYLLVWDTAAACSGMQPLPLLPDAPGDGAASELPVWGELSDLRARADALGQLYKIDIVFGQELPDEIGIYRLAKDNDAASLSEALDVVSRSLGCYPADFFEQLRFGDFTQIIIYLSGNISSDTAGMLEAPTGFMDSFDNRLVMILNTEYCWDWEYTINHEISHMIDRRLLYRADYVADALFSEEEWTSFNPEEFAYLGTYDDYEGNPAYTRYPDYFADAYGITFATEDRAELFGLAMSDYLGSFDEDSFFKKGAPTTEKYKYYCACIRDGFDSADWDDVMPWEAILQGK